MKTVDKYLASNNFQFDYINASYKCEFLQIDKADKLKLAIPC